MLSKRIIARIDIKGPNVVKGVNMEGLRVVGNPIEMARKYYEESIDEIIFLDTVASLYGRNNILSVISEAADKVFVPICVGGGLRSLKDVRAAFDAGAEKVCINTYLHEDITLLDRAADLFGSQSIVVMIESMNGECMMDNARERTGKNVIEWAEEVQEHGAGELLLVSVDRDGTRSGFDLDLYNRVSCSVGIPVIMSGGSWTVDHVLSAFQEQVYSVACASMFHYVNCSVTDLKEYLKSKGERVRCLR